MNEIERLPLSSEWLRSFLAVAEAGNVTHAAERLGRTQSAISVQIRKLEEGVSARLFARQARGMVLTEEGQRLLPVAQRTLSELGRIAELFSHPLSGRIRVGIPDDYSIAVLERVLAAFAVRHPGVEVSVRSGFSIGFPDAVKRGELDLAVYTAAPGERLGKPLLREQTVWAAEATLSIAEDEPVPLALFDRACWWRDAAIEAMERAGRPYRVAYSSESVAGVKAAIGAGLAVGVLSASAVDGAMRVLGEGDGFPALPRSSLVLLIGDTAAQSVAQEMERAIRAALLSG